VGETGTAQAVSPLHSTSKDAGGDLDAVFASDGARRRTRTAGVPPVLASYAPDRADVEETSTGDLALRLEIVRRAPVRALTTPTKRGCDLTRRGAGSRRLLGAMSADNVLCARRTRASSASYVRTRPQARLAALARAPVRECSSGSLAFCALHAADTCAHGFLAHAVTVRISSCT
jgi:hypothetical protein